MKFHIEKGISMPTTRTAKNPVSESIDAQLKLMHVGDSFFITFNNPTPEDKTYSPIARTIMHRAKRMRINTDNQYSFSHRLMQYSIGGKIQWGIRTFRVEPGSIVQGLPRTRKSKPEAKSETESATAESHVGQASISDVAEVEASLIKGGPLDVTSLDVTSLDVTSLDVTSLDVTSLDKTALDMSALTR